MTARSWPPSFSHFSACVSAAVVFQDRQDTASFLALVGIFPAVALGYMDWQYLRGDTWVLAITMKIGLATVLSSCYPLPLSAN